MKILVTGSKGFVGRNLITQLNNEDYQDIIEFNREDMLSSLESKLENVDFIFHLAGVNRPKDNTEFYVGNTDLTTQLIELLKAKKMRTPIIYTSSIQAALDNDYGKSKKMAEDQLFEYAQTQSTPVYIYRLSNLFGKWSRPNYNSVVATFAHNLTHNIPLQINDPDVTLNLNYIDNVIGDFIRTMKNGHPTKEGQYCIVPESYEITVGELAGKLQKFHDNRETLVMPSLKAQFDRDLYGTYLSYLPEDQFSYYLKKNEDNRGWLAEFIKSEDNGQIFISTTKPGITRGNHWHHTKVEKFLVIQGTGLIEFRQVGTDKILKYPVSGDKPEVVDIPVGYTHNISNTGAETMITLFWACEIFDPEKPDTYYEGV